MQGGVRRLGRAIALCLCCGLLPQLAVVADVPAESSELVTALTGLFPPFSYFDASGELAGFDVALSREIARRLGRPARIIATEWDGILSGLLAGKYDAIIGSMVLRS